MDSSENSNIDSIETDIAVIGAGGGGLAAAAAAGEKGAKVIVLEKETVYGGNSNMPWGLFAADSALQKRLRIDVTKDAMFKFAVEYAHWRIDPRIVRAFIDKSADTIQWLEDKGVSFNHIPLMYSAQPFPTWHCPSVEKRGGRKIIQALVRSCEAMGIRLLAGTAAKKILTGDSGEVIGVMAEAPGRQLRIIAKNVIIGTGGYGGNRDLLKRFYASYSEELRVSGLPLMGDGLLMATEVGAATEGLGTLILAGPHFISSRPNQPRFALHASSGSAAYQAVNGIVQEPNTIWVNKNGERFVDEKKGAQYRAQAGNALERQPGKISFTLLDEKIKCRVVEQGLVEGLSIHNPALTKLPEVEQELQFESEHGKVKISESWDEIAAWMGAVPEVLKATIDQYNSFCDKGHDDLFVKDRRYLQALRIPPYYAIRCIPAFTNTVGGIKINHRMEVLDKEDKPIPGLYAVGVDAGGWVGDTYQWIADGFGLGFPINSGRIAGENAAKHPSG